MDWPASHKLARTHREVLDLLQSPDPPSRNLNFGRFAGEEGRLVHRLHRLYRSLAAETRRARNRPGASARLVTENGHTWLELKDPKLNYARKSLLPPPLAEHFKQILTGS